MLFSPLPGKQDVDFRIVQKYGSRPEYYIKYGHRGHTGTDYAPKNPGQKGVLVYAPHEGYIRVTNSGRIGYGLHIEITSLPYEHCVSRKSTLAHLEKVFVTNNQFVAAGDPIAVMGGGKGMPGAGDSTGIHLHHDYRKVNAFGETLNADNGFDGCIDVLRYVKPWEFGATLV